MLLSISSHYKPEFQNALCQACPSCVHCFMRAAEQSYGFGRAGPISFISQVRKGLREIMALGWGNSPWPALESISSVPTGFVSFCCDFTAFPKAIAIMD